MPQLPLEVIEKGLPTEVTDQLIDNETVHYFSYISYKGGCLSSSSRTDYYWITLTNKRVLYKAKVGEQDREIEKEGILPIEKISFIEVTEISKSGCLNSGKFFAIRISTSGGTVEIPVPTKEKGNEIRMVFLRITEYYKP